MSLPPCLPELHKLFPQLAYQLKCLNGEHRLQYLSHQSSASIVRCMRDLLSDPCHVLPEHLVQVEHPGLDMQLKKEALDEVASLVSESTFTCAPRFPGRMPSLITVEDKKRMIVNDESLTLYPGYKVPTIGFCFDVFGQHTGEFRDGDRVVSRASSGKVGHIVSRLSPTKLLVKWDCDSEEDDRKEHEQAELQLLDKVRVLITTKSGQTESNLKGDSPLSEWCKVETAFTTNDQDPKEVFVCTDTHYTLSVLKEANHSKAFIKDVDESLNDAKIALLDQCHEYTILKGLARRLAESFSQLTRVSAERKALQDLREKNQKIEDRELEQKAKTDGTKEVGTENGTIKQKWQDKIARHAHVNDEFLKWKLSPNCGYETILKAVKKAWTRVPCVLDSKSTVDLKSKSVFERRFSAIFRWSQSQPQPCRLVPDPYHLTQSTTSGPTVCEHYFSEASVRSDCLLVGDHVASSSLDPPQSYLTVAAFRYNEFEGKWFDECFQGDSDDMYTIAVDIGMCPSWRSLLTQDAFFELDFNGCGNGEVFRIEHVERLSYVHFNIHFKCSPHHHKSFLKWFEVFKKSAELLKQREEMQQMKDKKARDQSEKAFVEKKSSVPGFKEMKLNSFFFFRPFASESLGRFHASFEYLLEVCYLFCHLIAKGLLERYDHKSMQVDLREHLYDTVAFKYDDYQTFLRREGCILIYPTVVKFLRQADDRRMQLLDIMPFGAHLRDDATYKSCLTVANRVQDTLFLLKETLKNVLDYPIPDTLPPQCTPSELNPLDTNINMLHPRNSSALSHPLPTGYRFNHCYCYQNQRCESCMKHNQGCLRRSIYCFNSSIAEPTEVERNFEIFERFIDPFFVLPTLDDYDDLGKARDLRHLFFDLKRSLHSLELGFVCSFSKGSPQPLCVASIFLALRCRHNTSLLKTFQNQEHPHFKRYFELICFCGNFVRKNMTQARFAFPFGSVHGFASTPNLHRMVQVRMLDPAGRNDVVNDVLTHINENSAHRPKYLHFQRRLKNEESGPLRERVKFLAFLDCSRKLLSACYGDDVVPSLFWIPTPDTDDLEITRVINGPKTTLLWKDIDERYPLTAIATKAGKTVLSTGSQALKFEFLQFASHLLEARYYHSSETQVEHSIDLLAMWFDSRREIGTFSALKLFMCMLPPHEFAENRCKSEADLVTRMKAESLFSNFGNLKQDSFDIGGLKKLPHCQNELWEDFLQSAEDAQKLKDEDKSDEDRKRLELWVHLRTLAEWINESVVETYKLFWQYRVNVVSRGDSCRRISQFFHWNSVDKVFDILREFVMDYCHWIRSDHQAHFDISLQIYSPNPQPLVCLVSGLSLAIDCLASLPRYVVCVPGDNGSSSIIMYEQILDLLLLDSRPGMPFIHLLHSLDGTVRISSDLHSVLPSTPIALALQPSFVRLLGMGFSVCSLHFPGPRILGLEQRTWSILVKSFETCAMFLSGISGDSPNTVASQIAWVHSARALLQCAEFWTCASAPDHWQPEADSYDLCRVVDICLQCFTLSFSVCSNDCIVAAMDLLASILRLCTVSHDRVSSAMSLFRRFASLLPGSTVRATSSVKSSALRLLGACFQLGLLPRDLDEFSLNSNSRPNVPDLYFSSRGYSFGGGPLLSLGGIDLTAVDTFIKALHAPASSKLVPWFVAPLSPIVAVSQVCRSAMLFSRDLKLEQIMPNIRGYSLDERCVTEFLTESRMQLDDSSCWLQHVADCSSDIWHKTRLKTNLFDGGHVSFLPKLPSTSTVSEHSAQLESSFWLHLLTVAVAHLKGMLVLFVSFSLNKELAFTDFVPISKLKQHAILFPHFASSLDHPIMAPAVVLRQYTAPGAAASSHFVANPLCVPIFVRDKRIEPNSESKVEPSSETKNEFDSSISVSAYNSFLAILQVLMNGRLKLVEDIICKVSQKNPGKTPFVPFQSNWASLDVLLTEFCFNVHEKGFRLFDSLDPMVEFSKGHQGRFCFEHMLFLSDLFRLCVVDGSKTTDNSPNTISFVVRVATALAAIPARQTTKIVFSPAAAAADGIMPSPANVDPLPPLIGSVWPVVVALFVPGFSAFKFDGVHKIANHCAEHFSSLCLDLTGLSYKIAANSLNEHPSFPISDVLKCLGIEHVLPPQMMNARNSRALHFPHCFLDDFSRVLSVSGFCSDPGSMQVKKERDIAMKYFLSFFSFQTMSPGLSGIPSELLQHFVLNEAIMHSLCAQNFLPRLGRLPLLILPELHRSSYEIVGTHPFPSEKCAFDEQWYFFLKQLLCRLNCYHTSLVTSVFMLDFVRAFYSATFRSSKFISMGFSGFDPNPTAIAFDLFLEYQPQHSFVDTVVSIISSMGCMLPNSELAETYFSGCSREHAFIKKCFEFVGSMVEDNFVVECVDPAALRPLQSEMSVARNRLQDFEFNAVKQTSLKRFNSRQHAIERRSLSPTIARMEAVQVEMRQSPGGLSAHVIFPTRTREAHFATFVNVFDQQKCALWNQDKNTFLQRIPPQGAFLFDNQDLLLLKAAFREDFGIYGAKDEQLNGVYELYLFNGNIMESRYRINPRLSGARGSHHQSLADHSKSESMDLPNLPVLYFDTAHYDNTKRGRWVIFKGSTPCAYLEAPYKFDLKHGLSMSNWKEKDLPSDIRLELLTNTSSPTVSSIRRTALIRMVLKTGGLDAYKQLYKQWVTSANRVFENLSLYSKSSIFDAQLDCALPSFLGCFSSMISLLPRSRAAMYSPPLRNVCLVLTQYLRDSNPDDPNKLLTSSTLSAIGVILSTFSLAAEIPELFDPSKSSFVPPFVEYVLDRIYRELVCFCDSGILPVLKDQSSFCCSRSLDALLSMCGSASIATSLLSLASVLGAVAHCHHAVHLWESESSDPNDMQRGFGRVWKIKESLFTYRSLGTTSNAHERSLQHRNYVKILRFLSLVCERSRREETFSLRSNLMLGNSMHSLVDSISSNIDQQVPMDALNCVRLSLECWPRISDIVAKVKQLYESGGSTSVAQPLPQSSPQNLSLGDLHELSAWISLSCNSMCALPTVIQPKLQNEMKSLVSHLVDCLFRFKSLIADLWHQQMYHTEHFCGIKPFFCSSEEKPSEDALLNDRGRSVYVHQPLLILCGAISHICYCLQTLYFFKTGSLPRVLFADGKDTNCDKPLTECAVGLLEALVQIFMVAQETSCSSLDSELLLHRFTEGEMNCFASAVESLFELCLRIRLYPSDPNGPKHAHLEHEILTHVQKLHPASHSKQHAHAAEGELENLCKKCEEWRSRSFHIYKRVFALLQDCGDSLDLPKSLLETR